MNGKAWVLVVLAGLALAGAYAALRPAPVAAPGDVAGAMPEPAPAAFEFEISGGNVRGPLELRVREGQRVTLRVRSDVADELHVHGYDLSAPLPAGEPVALAFIATRAGRFEIELHRAHRELRALEVEPR